MYVRSPKKSLPIDGGQKKEKRRTSFFSKKRQMSSSSSSSNRRQIEWRTTRRKQKADGAGLDGGGGGVALFVVVFAMMMMPLLLLLRPSAAHENASSSSSNVDWPSGSSRRWPLRRCVASCRASSKSSSEGTYFKPGRTDSIIIVTVFVEIIVALLRTTASCTLCLLYTSPSPRDRTRSRMPSSA